VQATSCLNDLAVAALVVATAALIVHEAPLGLVATAASLGAGTKGTFLYALPGLGLLWLMERRSRASVVRRPAGAAYTPAAARRALHLAAVALVVGTCWYARNATWFGNPLYPMSARGVVESSGYVTVRFGMSVPGWMENFSELLESRLGDREAAYSALSRKVSGWGALPFACGLPALLLALPRDPRLRRLTLGLAASLASVLLLVQHDDWFARFVLFFPVVLVLAVAKVAAERRAVLLVAVPALALQVASTMVPEELPWPRVQVLAGQPWRQRSTAGIYDTETEGAALIGYYGEGYNDSYLLYRPDFSRRIVYLRARTSAELADEIRKSGVAVVYSVPGTPERREVLDRALRSGFLTRLRGRFYATALP
jgi:hypothetical protein